MGRRPCCEKERVNRGAWTAMEDKLLTDHIKLHGEGRWRSLPKIAGLQRCGKSCRLRWLNYLRPEIKRGNITADEEDLIIRLHNLLGNRWSLIAGRLPGRTDNEIKNYWNTNISKRMVQDDHCRSILKRKSSCCKKRSNTESSPVVVRAKAVKCSTRVFIAPPPPPTPPEPPLPPPSTSAETREIEDSLGFGEGLMDLPEMEFSLSFSEFFDSEKLASDICCNEFSLEDAGEQFASPEDPFDDGGGVFSEEMMGDWRRGSCALDASTLANWLGV